MRIGSHLQRKVVVITGGARGIGRATARAFTAAGARVAIGDIDGALAEREAAAMGALGGVLDVRERASFADFIDTVRGTLGPVDVLVNNAGIMPTGAFHESAPAQDDAQIDINLRGVIHGMRAVLPEMLKRRSGHIVNVASMAGRLAIPGLAVYCATKHAVVGLTESLAEEYRDAGVTFSTILPSKVRTELAAGTDGADTGIPAVDPEQVAAAIVHSAVRPRLFIAVPGYLENLSALYRMIPRPLVTGGRRLLGDDRVLHRLDETARAAYNQRIDRLAGHSGGAGA